MNAEGLSGPVLDGDEAPMAADRLDQDTSALITPLSDVPGFEPCRGPGRAFGQGSSISVFRAHS